MGWIRDSFSSVVFLRGREGGAMKRIISSRDKNSPSVGSPVGSVGRSLVISRGIRSIIKLHSSREQLLWTAIYDESAFRMGGEGSRV